MAYKPERTQCESEQTDLPAKTQLYFSYWVLYRTSILQENQWFLAESYQRRTWSLKASPLCKFPLPPLVCPYLPKGLELGLHYEVILAELTASCVWALDPLVEAGLVDKAQGSCAATGCDEWALFISFAVTDPADVLSRWTDRQPWLAPGSCPCRWAACLEKQVR